MNRHPLEILINKRKISICIYVWATPSYRNRYLFFFCFFWWARVQLFFSYLNDLYYLNDSVRMTHPPSAIQFVLISLKCCLLIIDDRLFCKCFTYRVTAKVCAIGQYLDKAGWDLYCPRSATSKFYLCFSRYVRGRFSIEFQDTGDYSLF